MSEVSLVPATAEALLHHVGRSQPCRIDRLPVGGLPLEPTVGGPPQQRARRSRRRVEAMIADEPDVVAFLDEHALRHERVVSLAIAVGERRASASGRPVEPARTVRPSSVSCPVASTPLAREDDLDRARRVAVARSRVSSGQVPVGPVGASGWVVGDRRVGGRRVEDGLVLGAVRLRPRPWRRSARG